MFTKRTSPVTMFLSVSVIAGAIAITNAVLPANISNQEEVITLNSATPSADIPAKTHVYLQYTDGQRMQISRGVDLQGPGKWLVYRFSGNEPPFVTEQYFYSPAYDLPFGLTHVEPGTSYYVWTEQPMHFSITEGFTVSAMCGNGLVEDQEQCDNVPGCTTECIPTPGYSCDTQSNTCSRLVPVLETKTTSVQSSTSSQSSVPQSEETSSSVQQSEETSSSAPQVATNRNSIVLRPVADLTKILPTHNHRSKDYWRPVGATTYFSAINDDVFDIKDRSDYVEPNPKYVSSKDPMHATRFVVELGPVPENISDMRYAEVRIRSNVFADTNGIGRFPIILEEPLSTEKRMAAFFDLEQKYNRYGRDITFRVSIPGIAPYWQPIEKKVHSAKYAYVYAMDVVLGTEGCGDGIRQEEEECDDGNTSAKDGCSATCTQEDGVVCDTPIGELSECRIACGDGICMPEMNETIASCYQDCIGEVGISNWTIPGLDIPAPPGSDKVCARIDKEKSLTLADGSVIILWKQGIFQNGSCTAWKILIHRYTEEQGWKSIMPETTGMDVLNRQIGLSDNIRIFPSGENGFLLQWNYELYDKVQKGSEEVTGICGGERVSKCWREVMMEWSNGVWKPLKHIYEDGWKLHATKVFENANVAAVFVAWARTPLYAPTPAHQTSRLVVLKRTGGIWSVHEIDKKPLSPGVQEHTVEIKDLVDGVLNIEWNGEEYNISMQQ